jgi:hypothetical protein
VVLGASAGLFQASGTFMAWWVPALDVGIAIVLVVLWYFWCKKYNRLKGYQVLHWLQSGALRLRIAGIRWRSPSKLDIRLKFNSHCFRDAHVHVRLLPRELPINWLLCRLRREKETFSFEADLDCPPVFNLEVLNHRWANRQVRRLTADPKRVALVRAGALLFTTRTDWQPDLGRMMHGLLASRDYNFQKVCFHRSSPHFSAVLPLASVEQGGPEAGDLFEVLEELATAASAAMF